MRFAQSKDDLKDNPFNVECPACNAPVSQRCTAPTDTGRREVSWIHNARTDKAKGWT